MMKKRIFFTCIFAVETVFARVHAEGTGIKINTGLFTAILLAAVVALFFAIYWYLKYSKVKNQKGALTSIFDNNLSEFQLASFELERKEKELKLIIEHAPIGIAMVSTEGRLLEINQAYADILGYTQEELLAGKFYEVGYEPDVPKSEEQYEKLLEGKEFVHIDKRLVKKDGSIIYVSQRLVMIRNAENEPLFVLGMTVDISERQYALRKLRESEEFYRSVLKNMSGIVYNCENDRNWTMRYLSDGIIDISGFEAKEFLNNSVRSFESIIHPEDKEKVFKMVQSGIKEHNNYEQEYRIIHKNGNINWVYEIGRGIFDDIGNLKYLSGTIIDITKRKETELKLEKYREHLEELVEQRTKEIEEKNRKLEEFNKLFIGREFRIKDLRDEVNELKQKLSKLT